MLLQPCEKIYKRMVSEVTDDYHPEHLGTYGPEQDYLARFYCTFVRGEWSHIHAKYNYQLMLPEDYVSSAHRALDLQRDVVVAHYSGPRVKPWELERGVPLDLRGVERLLYDDSVRDCFGRQVQRHQGSRSQPARQRIMDGVLIVDKETPSGLPTNVQDVMFEWVSALRSCCGDLKEDRIDLLAVIDRL